MFRPRHAYKSPITNRYRGKAKGCPVFNNLIDINSTMVEQHDECLECLAKIKNRTDLYRTLADNIKPSNNVIKSLQRLSSSASNNRLKTCLQFLIIKVNEKSITAPQRTLSLTSSSTTTTANTTTTTTTTTTTPTTMTMPTSSPRMLDQIKDSEGQIEPVFTSEVKNSSQKRHRLHQKQRLSLKIQREKQQNQQLASPPQDQVSSTQDQDGPSHNDHDCQTSPMMLVTNETDDLQTELNEQQKTKQLDEDNSPITKLEDRSESPAQTQSSPLNNNAPTTTTSTTPTIALTTFSTSPTQTEAVGKSKIISNNNNNIINRNKNNGSHSRDTPTTADRTLSASSATSGLCSKRRKLLNSSDHDASSITSWSSSYNSPPSPMSTSSTSSISSSASSSTSDDDSRSSSSSSSSSCSSSSSLTPSLSPSSLSSPEIVNELRGPRLKLSEEKIRKIKKRPIQFDDFFTEHSFASTPTTSSGCSPGQHSNTTQNSDQSRFSIPLGNNVTHMFQAPPKFVNNLKPCNLPTKPQEPIPTQTPPASTKEKLNCAICGVKDRPPNISKIYGQNSCSTCTKFFAVFLKRPQQLYCAQDGDCLMTFDSRCQACWIKICLQKFDIEEEHRKTGLKYSPKLLSCPNVSLITIDTSPR